jgi:hypothetical protein
MTKPTAKTEQRFRDNLVQLSRRQLFIDGEPESECLEVMQWMVAGHKACRDHLEYDDIQAFVEEHAIEVKPVAVEIIERAKKAGRPNER